MSVLPYIPKDHQELPDSYGIKIFYHSGQSDDFEVAQHRLEKECGFLEFVTKDDVWNWVPLTSIKRLQFDKRFSKILALKSECVKGENA